MANSDHYGVCMDMFREKKHAGPFVMSIFCCKYSHSAGAFFFEFEIKWLIVLQWHGAYCSDAWKSKLPKIVLHKKLIAIKRIGYRPGCMSNKYVNMCVRSIKLIASRATIHYNKGLAKRFSFYGACV